MERRLNKEYIGISGIPDFTRASARLALGKENEQISNGLVSILIAVYVNPDSLTYARIVFIVLDSNCSDSLWHRGITCRSGIYQAIFSI